MNEVELSAGVIEYEEYGSPSSPTLVFIHGLLVGGSLWDPVAEQLDDLHRVIPTWPLGCHRRPLRDRSAATPIGVADLIAEFLEHKDLRDVTLVGNDTGGALTQMVVTRRPERVARVVLTNCDAYEHFPPAPFRPLVWLAKARLLGPMLQGLRIPALRPTPLAYGLLTKRPLPAELLERWVRPGLSDRRIRGDVTHFTAHIDRRDLLDTASRLGTVHAPVLLAWADEDRFFKVEFAERLAADLPDARIVRIPDSRTFVMRDQPERLAASISEFIAA